MVIILRMHPCISLTKNVISTRSCLISNYQAATKYRTYTDDYFLFFVDRFTAAYMQNVAYICTPEQLHTPSDTAHLAINTRTAVAAFASSSLLVNLPFPCPEAVKMIT